MRHWYPCKRRPSLSLSGMLWAAGETWSPWNHIETSTSAPSLRIKLDWSRRSVCVCVYRLWCRSYHPPPQGRLCWEQTRWFFPQNGGFRKITVYSPWLGELLSICKFIILNTKFIILNIKLIFINTKFIIFTGVVAVPAPVYTHTSQNWAKNSSKWWALYVKCWMIYWNMMILWQKCWEIDGFYDRFVRK